MNIPYLKVNSGAKTTMSTNLSSDNKIAATPNNSPVRPDVKQRLLLETPKDQQEKLVVPGAPVKQNRERRNRPPLGSNVTRQLF